MEVTTIKFMINSLIFLPWRLIRTSFHFFVLIFFLISATVIIIPLLALPLRKRLEWVTIVWFVFAWYILNICLWARLYLNDDRSPHLRKRVSSGLYICNHQSIWDIPLSLYLFQIPPIMKKETLKIPLFGILGMASGAIVLDRKDKDSRRKVLLEVRKRLNENLPVLVYPEGTRNKDSLAPKNYEQIKVGTLETAYDCNVPVIPVAMVGTKNVANKFGIFNLNSKLGIHALKEVYPKDFETKQDFCKHCWDILCNRHLSLSEELFSKDKKN